MNQKETPFNLEEWLNTKKTGFSGKVPRADFIAKIKELGAEIEQLQQHQNQLTIQNNQLTDQLKAQQQLVQTKDQEITEIKAELTKQTTKLGEQVKILQVKEEELKVLQSRLDITNQKYQAILANQEKHQAEDLKPANLPDNWEKQLEQLKVIETKLIELEERPTSEQLKKAVQQVTDKYQDYQKLTAEEQTALTNYPVVKKELEQWLNTFAGKSLAEVKQKYAEPKGQVLTSAELEKLNHYDTLKSELAIKLLEVQRLKGELAQSTPSINDSELQNNILTEIKNLTPLISSLQQEIKGLKPSSVQSFSEVPSDYNLLKNENEELYKMLQTWKLKLLASEKET